MASIERLSFFVHWIGFADPPSRTEKWSAVRDGDGYEWHSEPDDRTGGLPADRVEALSQALELPPVPTFDASRFDLPAHAIARHYDSIWTDDGASWLLGILWADGRYAEVTSDAQHAFMLPIRVNDSSRDEPFATYEPALSRAIAALLPDGFLEKDRLAGQFGMLEYDLREPEPEPVADEPEAEIVPPSPEAMKEAEERIFNILFGVESVEEKAEAERTGRISQRLLKRIPTADIFDLIARGADVNVADDVGQTALMETAFPPFNRDAFRALAAAGAHVEARRNDGMTGLHIACAGGERHAAEEWLRAGADVNARGPGNFTPLMLAATWPRIVEMLLKAGADVAAADDDGHTALEYVVIPQRGVTPDDERNAIRMLLEAGADPNRTDHQSRTPIDHARHALRVARLEIEAAEVMAGPPVERRSEILDAKVQHAVAILAILEDFRVDTPAAGRHTA